jgi:hypothetical protein
VGLSRARSESIAWHQQPLDIVSSRNCRCIQGQGLGIVVWSLAKINYDASRVRHLLQAFAQEAVHRLNSAAHSSDASIKLGAQSLSNMLYAYALLNHHPGTQLLSAIAKGVQWQLRDFSPQASMASHHLHPARCLGTSPNLCAVCSGRHAVEFYINYAAGAVQHSVEPGKAGRRAQSGHCAAAGGHFWGGC